MCNRTRGTETCNKWRVNTSYNYYYIFVWYKSNTTVIQPRFPLVTIRLNIAEYGFVLYFWVTTHRCYKFSYITMTVPYNPTASDRRRMAVPIRCMNNTCLGWLGALKGRQRPALRFAVGEMDVLCAVHDRVHRVEQRWINVSTFGRECAWLTEKALKKTQLMDIHWKIPCIEYWSIHDANRTPSTRHCYCKPVEW